MSASALELKLLAQIEQAGLPYPRTEYYFAMPRRWRFDLCYPGLLVAIEVEGGTWVNGRHNRGSGYRADIDKYNEAATRGWLVLRVTGDMISDGSALGLLSRVLRERNCVMGD